MSTPNVLLVDDRAENLVALEAVLAPLDCRTVSARSGAEALRRLLEDEFAVILLDVQMPDLDGFETAEYIKRRDRTKTVPIIFVTAISKEPHHVFRGYEAGAVDYVFKPYDPAVLRSKVSVFLELWRQRRAVERSEALAQATFAAAPIGMARMDRDGRIVAANRALSETLGIPRAELEGSTIDELTHPEDRRADAEQRRRLLAGKIERYDVERRLLGADGTVPAQVSFALAHAGDADSSLIAQVQDLRERQRAERARELLIREQAARLEAEAVSERLQGIQRIVDAALAPMALDDLLGELLTRIAEVLKVDSAGMVLIEAEDAHVVVRAAEGVGASVRRESVEPLDEGLVARVLSADGAVIVDDVMAEGIGDALAGEAVTSVIAVPLHIEGTVIGVLGVGTLFQRSFTAADADLLQLAAERAALAIERTRLFEREHRIAQQLQRALLPQQLPAVPGLRLAARYLPGGAGTEVGGDWYDALSLPDGRLGLVMGDVQGRGVPAAATMGQLRSALRAYALEGAGPAEILDRLNRFQLQLGEDRMATVLMLVLDPVAGVLRYSNAGHPPPLLVQPHQAQYLDGGRGVPLGALDEPAYTEAEAALDPGSTVVLYTDGLIEHRDWTLEEGFEKLRGAITDHELDPESLCEAILGGTLGEATSDDDVTFVVASSPPLLGDHVSLSLPGRADGLTSLRATVRRWLVEIDAEEEEIHAVTMAANEAVENAIEHGHRNSAEPFIVELARAGEEIVITVRDRGRWHDGLSEDRGRGLPLIRELMQDVEIERTSGGTVVTMRKRLRGGTKVRAAAAAAARVSAGS